MKTRYKITIIAFSILFGILFIPLIASNLYCDYLTDFCTSRITGVGPGGIYLPAEWRVRENCHVVNDETGEREPCRIDVAQINWPFPPRIHEYELDRECDEICPDSQEIIIDENKDMLSSKYIGISDVKQLLVENKINYLQDKLVVTVGSSIRGDPDCGAVVDTDSNTHWFGINSVSNPTEMTLYSENPQQCIVNTSSCFCNAQIELTSLTLDDLVYFSSEEQEKQAKNLIDYLYEENINRTPKFQIGKHNLNYTDSSAIGYCGQIWGTNTYGFFSGAIVNDVIVDYKISKKLPLLCAISDDAKWWENES